MLVKRVLSLLVLSLVLVQLFMLPSVVNGYITPVVNGYTTPVVTTLPATDVATSAATLNATVLCAIGNNGNLVYVNDTYELNGTNSNTAYFQYGTESGVYNDRTATITVSSGNTFSARVVGLYTCKKYYARAVLTYVVPQKYNSESHDYLISFLSGNPSYTGMRGLGVGLGFTPAGKQLNSPLVTTNAYGNEITFTTTGCSISTGPLGQGGGVGTGSTAISTTGPIQMSNIVVQKAVIATPKAAPGEKVDITASVINKGSSNGDAKVTLYVNGQEVESQGITLSSGQTAPLHFYLSRNEPGTYSVTVDGVSAGSFTVDTFANNDALIYGIIALFTIGISAVIYMVTRKRIA
jgi:hypothetical protein